MTLLKKILRWVAVLPAALLAFIAVMFLIHGMALLAHWLALWALGNTAVNFLELSAEAIERFGDAFFAPFTLMYVGTHVAPRFKFIAGIVLTLLNAYISALIVSLLYPAAPHGRTIEDSWFRITLLFVLWVAAVVSALVEARKADKEKRKIEQITSDPISPLIEGEHFRA